MTTDVVQQHQSQAASRSLFKMNPDFWQQPRGPPIGAATAAAAAAPSGSHHHHQQQQQQQQPPPPSHHHHHHLLLNAMASTAASLNSAGNGSNPNNGNVSGDPGPSSSPGPNLLNNGGASMHHQMPQQQQLQQQQQQQQTGGEPPLTAADMAPGGHADLQQQIQMQQNQLHQQHEQLGMPPQPALVHPPPALTPSGGSSTPDTKFNSEKFVNEIQLQLSRSNSAAAISERTLEECWSTLQRLFMHKSAMQQIQQIPRVGLGSAGMGAESKPHQCQQCLKSFSSNHQLVQHIRVHTGEKPYKCSYCDRRFKQLSHVQQHTRLHTGERPYKCHLPECGRAFIQLSNLQQHLRNHDAQVERAKNRPFHCNICGKGFATESSLRTHTSKELQLHLGVLQQHAALIGGPNATSCPICHKLFLGGEALMEHMKHTHKDPNASGVATKRRTANHPCPVCGKHYVNEGSLRKHLACHPETSQLTSSLRMWPCSVCQAVFTHENGLLTHMERMRMDPKHQFAAQYVLSRAAAERRERDSILAATLAVSASSSGLLSMGGVGGVDGGGGSNSMCPSPSANSDCSSGNGRLSSAGSEPGSGLMNNNNNCSSKLSDILRSSNNGHLHSQYGVDDLHANRMSLMAAAAGIVSQSGGGVVPGGLGSPGVDTSTAGAVQAAVVNLAAAMRMNQVNNSNGGGVGGVNAGGGGGPGSTGGAPSASSPSPLNSDSAAAAAQAAMNVMRVSMADSMMRSSMAANDPMSHQAHHHHHHQHHPQNSPEAAIRMQHAEAILRSQAEAAIRLAVSVATSNNGGQAGDLNASNALRHHNGSAFGQQLQLQNSGNSAPSGANVGEQLSPQQHQQQQQQTLQQQSQVSPDISEAIRLQEHRLEQALRLHNDARALNFLTAGNGQQAAHNP